MVAIRPRTARAVKAIGLIGGQQGFGALDGDILVQQGVLDTVERTPATGGALVKSDFLFVHGKPSTAASG